MIQIQDEKSFGIIKVHSRYFEQYVSAKQLNNKREISIAQSRANNLIVLV